MRTDVCGCARFFLENDGFVLLCHRDPDGDTYGSATALADALLAMNRQVRIECVDAFPKNLRFLDRTYPDFPARHFVSIDVAAPNMLGDQGERETKIDLCIDHHPTNPDYADQSWVVPYAATGEAIYELLREMKAPVSPFAATAMFAALSSDTGGFSFANTTAQTHRYAADLLDLGADAETVRRCLFESNSRGRVQVESEAMANARYYFDGRLAVISVSVADTVRCGVEESELEGLAAQPLKIDGVQAAATLKERSDGSIRVSLRSDSDKADVSKVCRRFCGGGHVRASGCRIWDTLENAEAMLVAACGEELFG